MSEILKQLTKANPKITIEPYDNPHPLIELSHETAKKDGEHRQYHAIVRYDGQTLHLSNYYLNVLIGEAAKHLQLLAQTEE